MFKKTVFALSLLISAPMFANEPTYLLSRETVTKVITASRKYAKQAKETAQTIGHKVAEKASATTTSVKQAATIAKTHAVQAKDKVAQGAKSAINYAQQGTSHASTKALAAKEYVLSGAAAAYVNARLQDSQKWTKAHPYKTTGIAAGVVIAPYVLYKACQGAKHGANWLKKLARKPFTIGYTTYQLNI